MKKKITSLLLSVAILFSAMVAVPGIFTVKANADTIVSNGTYYIKNKLSGQYLAVDGTDLLTATSVVQVKHSTGSEWAKIWTVQRNSNGDYEISVSSGSVRRTLSVDTSRPVSDNGKYLTLISPDSTATNNKFRFDQLSDKSYKIKTKASNYTNVLAVLYASASEHENVVQYTYGSSDNDEWLLIPCTASDTYNGALAAEYALANAYGNIPAYPRLIGGADDVNFISQCMHAGGMKFQDDWYIYRKSYSSVITPADPNDLVVDWSISNLDSSPWLDYDAFFYYWAEKISYGDYFDKTDALSTSTYNTYGVGDIIMIALDDEDETIVAASIITSKTSTNLCITDHNGHVNMPLSQYLSLYGSRDIGIIFMQF